MEGKVWPPGGQKVGGANLLWSMKGLMDQTKWLEFLLYSECSGGVCVEGSKQGVVSPLCQIRGSQCPGAAGKPPREFLNKPTL